MKQIISCLLVCLIVISSCERNDPNEDNPKGIHIRQGFSDFGGQFKEYKFYNVPETAGYLTSFPIEKIKEKVSVEILENWDINNIIFTSIEDAELSIVERRDMSNLFVFNMIDHPFSDGQIGDNCWYQEMSGYIQFLRNNVLVEIFPNMDNLPSDDSLFEWLAREVDAAIISSIKVYDSKLIPAPIINSVEIISELPKYWGETVKVRVNAIERNSQQLFYRKYADGFAIISETGVISFGLYNYPANWSEDTTKAKVKIWVWNEDYLTSSVYIEFSNISSP